jgi:murein DD-endopeptidase MepM/ murein hydrolase activator NlpD
MLCRVFVLLIGLLASKATWGELLEYYGALKPGGVVLGRVTPGDSVRLNDQDVVVSSEGYFVLGFGRDAGLVQSLTVMSEGREAVTQLKLSPREYVTQKVEGVPKQTVTPSKEKLARIKEEASLVRKARAKSSDRLDFLGSFDVPADGPITGVYGSQRYYNGVPKRPHYGVDYAGPVGSPVRAPANGVVTLVHPDMFYSGGTLIVDHGHSLSSTFIHLSEVLVKEGQEVKKGDLIAKIGKGGRATGPHLDWRMNWQDQRVDPALMLELSVPESFYLPSKL